MKVSIYDREGNCVGTAFHENTHGFVSFPPATKEVIVVCYNINDGEMQPLPPMRMPVDAEYAIRVHDPEDSLTARMMRQAALDGHNSEEEVAELATPLSWWARIRQWRPFS